MKYGLILWNDWEWEMDWFTNFKKAHEKYLKEKSVYEAYLVEVLEEQKKKYKKPEKQLTEEEVMSLNKKRAKEIAELRKKEELYLKELRKEVELNG